MRFRASKPRAADASTSETREKSSTTTTRAASLPAMRPKAAANSSVSSRDFVPPSAAETSSRSPGVVANERRPWSLTTRRRSAVSASLIAASASRWRFEEISAPVRTRRTARAAGVEPMRTTSPIDDSTMPSPKPITNPQDNVSTGTTRMTSRSRGCGMSRNKAATIDSSRKSQASQRRYAATTQRGAIAATYGRAAAPQHMATRTAHGAARGGTPRFGNARAARCCA
mmetsp:Transcript_18237/g.56959  ORF Transcript_18237/g.56959 Transcript_18237/m.56959 type:complete len:228 (+) Transcript_18237:337-1020(+)